MSLLDEFSIPNLDIDTACGEEGEAEYLAIEEAAHNLSNYCHNRAWAVIHRSKGFIGQAKECEEKAERNYSALPDSWKW